MFRKLKLVNVLNLCLMNESVGYVKGQPAVIALIYKSDLNLKLLTEEFYTFSTFKPAQIPFQISQNYHFYRSWSNRSDSVSLTWWGLHQTKVPPSSDPPLLPASEAPTCPHSACLLCRDLMRSDVRPAPTSRHTRVAHFWRPESCAILTSVLTET